MKLFIAILATIIMASPGVAYADAPPGGQGTEGAMSPTLSDVTLVICTVPGACVIGPR